MKYNNLYFITRCSVLADIDQGYGMKKIKLPIYRKTDFTFQFGVHKGSHKGQ